MKQVNQIDINQKTSIEDILIQFKNGAFNARRLGIAFDIMKSMLKDKDCTKFLALSGALTPAGLRTIIAKSISEKFFDVVISTGAILTHDLIEVLGFPHIRITEEISDCELRKKGRSRILDATIDDSAFSKLEEWIRSTLSHLYDKQTLKGAVPTPKLLLELGKTIETKESILASAAQASVPIFCPAITDSMLGLHIALMSQEIDLMLDPNAELQEMLSTAFESTKTGALVVGGGVPKNYTLQAMLASSKSLSYGIQITMDRPEHGGLSGASLEEAISWGKIDPKSKRVTVVSDATIVLPLLLGAFL